ncbi:MAG TPA: RNA helicase, partial [Alphaproteobacteria bacterium]|nr:RNA helicase [Alphaproteobacteria bacterium]
TPIQAQAIPPALEGRDLLGIAQTGTGKTAAFALPILDRLAATPGRKPARSMRALILAPTRELAGQIAQSFSTYGAQQRPVVVTIFGGVPINRQARAMAGGADIVVATPGRLIDLIQQRAVDLNGVEMLVLDEADQMMDLGFIHALRRIVSLLPKVRQTMFFSATMPKAIAELAGQFLTTPVQVAVTPAATTAERVDQRAVFVRQADKGALLIHALRIPDVGRALVFTRTKHGADKVVRQLQAAALGAEAIHGNKSQPQREKALRAFRAGHIRVLVATDIAARGIDIDDVTHVFNFDIPHVPEQYVHRIGRTARAGASGLAIAFVSDEEKSLLRDIERTTRVKIMVEALPHDFRPAARPVHVPAPAEPVAGAAPVAHAPAGERPRAPDRRPGGQPKPFKPRFGKDKGRPQGSGGKPSHHRGQGGPRRDPQGASGQRAAQRG